MEQQWMKIQFPKINMRKQTFHSKFITIPNLSLKTTIKKRKNDIFVFIRCITSSYLLIQPATICFWQFSERPFGYKKGCDKDFRASVATSKVYGGGVLLINGFFTSTEEQEVENYNLHLMEHHLVVK